MDRANILKFKKAFTQPLWSKTKCLSLMASGSLILGYVMTQKRDMKKFVKAHNRIEDKRKDEVKVDNIPKFSEKSKKSVFALCM